jgi:hypothetical protein
MQKGVGRMVGIQIIPAEDVNLKRGLEKKERELRQRGAGTFRRAGPSKWKHTRFKGFVKFDKAIGDVLCVEITSGRSAEEDEWQLLRAFVGFLYRHFKDEVLSMTVQFK